MKLSTLPTNLLPLLTVSLISIGAGYSIGNLYSHSLERLCRTRTSNEKEDVRETDSEDGENNDDNEIDEEGIPDGDLGAIKAGLLEPCKMVLVVRGDLNLSQNEIVSYCSQATLSCYKTLSKVNKPLLQHWERIGQAKIALRAESESQLLELEAIAKSLNLCARIMRGNGSASGGSTHTHASETNPNAPASPTVTVLAIGPAPVELVNEVTGKLKLL